MLGVVWSIATSRIGMVVIAGTVAYHAGYWKGYAAADKASEISSLESRLATANADLDAAIVAEHDANAHAANIAAYSERIRAKVDEIEAETRGRCALTHDDAVRLRNIPAD